MRNYASRVSGHVLADGAALTLPAGYFVRFMVFEMPDAKQFHQPFNRTLIGRRKRNILICGKMGKQGIFPKQKSR
jgi:hypothetical protein